MQQKTTVTPALKRWFILHFAADIAVALPLMIAPTAFLSMLGWQSVDPIAARLVAAALFGIGIESFLGRNGDIDSFRTMLNLKIIWSVTAAAGILVSMLQNAQGGPLWGWIFFAVFASFNILWTWWRIRLR